ncbi:polysaccharide biosynthesis tyrosine autokinase [Gordonia jinhuaensis]|uniref:polysaccharide biosynthesis tyrosine autokinase n=1 Tax=Gordonia jinhuaensis TaxID=1517702 RepID=UPI001668304E|nr:polysaccharide biosynthesis tyrosine autokinase [Gordonia jinhuaensis]
MAAIGRRWLVVVITVVIALAVAAGVSAATTPTYEAKSDIFLSASGDGTASDAYQGSLFTKDRISTYVDIATGIDVAKASIAELGLAMTPEKLQSEISAEAPSNSVMLSITASNSDARTARDISTEVAKQTASAIENLEASSKGAQVARAEVVNNATIPSSPSSPNWGLNLLIALVVGVVIGIVAAVVRDKTDHRIRTVGDLAGAGAPAPVLARIPRAKKGEVFGVAGASAITEAFRELRTMLFAQARTNTGSVVTLTGTSAGADGIGYVRNLAAAIAETGRSVLVLDAGLGSAESSDTPAGVSEEMGAGDSRGLTDVLAGGVSVDDVLAETSVDNVSLLPRGTGSRVTAGALGSSAFVDVLKQLRGQFSYVLVATPALARSTDGVVVAPATDGVLFTVEQGGATREEVAEAVVTFDQSGSGIVGTVLADAHRATSGL